MRPLVARLAGAGGMMFLALGGAAFTLQDRAEAASPVCFTTPAGCYCVDFFLTKAKEELIGELQGYINNLMGEHNSLKEMGVEDALGGHVGNGYTYEDLLDDSLRTEMNKPVSERPMPTSGDIPQGIRDTMERDPQSETRLGRQARSVATAAASPESMAPYTVDSESEENTAKPDDIQDWTDRMVLEPHEIEVPSDQELAEMPMSKLMKLYEDVRHNLGATYARSYLKELAASEQRLQALSKSRESLELDQVDQSGALQSANLVADTLKLAIDAELLESKLRQEALMGSLIAMRIGGEKHAEQ